MFYALYSPSTNVLIRLDLSFYTTRHCLLTPEGIHEQLFPAPHRLVQILNLFDQEKLLRILHELLIGTASLLETEVDDGFWTCGEDVTNSLDEEGEGWLEVDAVGGEDVSRWVCGKSGRHWFTPENVLVKVIEGCGRWRARM